MISYTRKMELIAKANELAEQANKLLDVCEDGYDDPTDVDYEDWVGRLVWVGYEGSKIWDGPYVLDGILSDEDAVEGRVFCVCDETFQKAKLYQGPTYPNWIDNTGEAPQGLGSQQVLVELRNGDLLVGSVEEFCWKKVEIPADIIRYTPIII